ncbi:MAG TPA: hypothetical protein VFW35_02255 [Sphingomicrobium sp.]|nr:hypothetical protein [Sphingomicrobium sp.]
MAGAGLALPIVTMSEAQAYVRIETGEEEAILAGLIRTASALCESFINQVVIARPFTLAVPTSGQWERFQITPVRSITDVSSVDASGAATVLPAGSYEIDIDSTGDGWVRVTQSPFVLTSLAASNGSATATIDPSDGSLLAGQGSGALRLQVSGSAGMADDENDVPEPIRQGVLRLVAHLFTVRDGDGGEPPAAVTALWRPYRRMRMA